MKPSQLKLLKQFNPSHKSNGGTVSVSYPNGVWGGAPAADDFGVFHSRKRSIWCYIGHTFLTIFYYLKIENSSSSRMKFEKNPNQPILALISVEFEMKLSQLKL